MRPRRRSWVVHGACWRAEWRWALGVPHVAATGATRAATRKAGAVAQRGGRSRLRLFSSRRTVHVDELKMARGVVVPRALRRGANRGSGTGSSGELGAVRGARSLTGVESCWRRSSMAHDSIHRRRSALALEIWPLRGHGIILSRFGGRRGRTARSRWHDAATRVAARGGLGRREAQRTLGCDSSRPLAVCVPVAQGGHPRQNRLRHPLRTPQQSIRHAAAPVARRVAAPWHARACAQRRFRADDREAMHPTLWRPDGRFRGFVPRLRVPGSFRRRATDASPSAIWCASAHVVHLAIGHAPAARR